MRTLTFPFDGLVIASVLPQATQQIGRSSQRRDQRGLDGAENCGLRNHNQLLIGVAFELSEQKEQWLQTMPHSAVRMHNLRDQRTGSLLQANRAVIELLSGWYAARYEREAAR